MSAPKAFNILESDSDIKKLIKINSPMIAKRLQALLVFKKHEKTGGISKRDVARQIGVNHNSIQAWRNLYICEGIEKLMSHSKIGYKPSLISSEQEIALKEQMHKPDNGFVGFIELLAWFNEKYKTDVNYKTFHGFVVRKFKAKIKKARKLHVKKEQEKSDDLKKTLVRYAKKSSKPKAQSIKK
jgi:transposase